MPLIYCETHRTAENEFEFTHSWYIGAGSVREQIINRTVKNNDRLLAAIYNVGFACKSLSELDGQRYPLKVVGIESDKDGEDKRYGGEHDILYGLLCPSNDFEARRYRALYNEYNRYLGRIIQLTGLHNIKIVKQFAGENVRYG